MLITIIQNDLGQRFPCLLQFFGEIEFFPLHFAYESCFCGSCREDINMTVRLVVSCNGMKINTVRE